MFSAALRTPDAGRVGRALQDVAGDARHRLFPCPSSGWPQPQDMHMMVRSSIDDVYRYPPGFGYKRFEARPDRHGPCDPRNGGN